MTRADRRPGGVAGARIGRAGLLAGVSLTALVAAGLPARAGSPPPMSSQWLANLARSAGAGAAKAATINTPLATAQTQAAQSISNLTKMAAAIRAAQAFQASALTQDTTLKAAEGMRPGGLVPCTATLCNGQPAWIGATAPTVTTSGRHFDVTVKQTQSAALLDWASFSVGPNTSLTFDQSAGGASAYTWTALNKVSAKDAPSKILGSIKATGKVYIINQNGILFGRGSQVNVASLIASTANLATSVTPGVGGAASTVSFNLYGTADGNGGFVPTFTGAPDGSVVQVEAGARISIAAPTSATARPGYAMLFGGTALNAGSIDTPSGQTVLAAGRDFTLRQGYSTQGNQTATTLGSQVATTGIAGVTKNSGIITATDGDITLVGHNVIVGQNSVLLATTSVNERGTVHLLTDTSDTTASISILPSSVVAVMPDNSDTTALNSQRSQLIAQSASLDVLRTNPVSASNPQLNNVGTLADRLDLSRVEITTGGSVQFGGGSLTMAQGGQIAVQAAGRVTTESKAALDVSGQLNVALPMSNNELVISIEPYEQRDAPVNRLTGKLNNSSITLDARTLVLVPSSAQYATDRYYSAGGLLEVSGYLNTTGHTIGEWTSLGGRITLASSEVVAQTDSTFNIAGGSLNYQAGYIHNSYLRSASGQIYNIDTAPANIQYSGVFKGQSVDHPKWNMTDNYQAPMFAPAQTWQPGYTVGRDAGTLIISAPTAIFEGAISGGAVNGQYQTTARSASLTDGYAAAQNNVALGGTLAIGQYNATGLLAALPSDIRIEAAPPALADSLSGGAPIATDGELNRRVKTVWLSSGVLNNAELDGLQIASTGTITVSDPVTLAPGGVASLRANVVQLQSGITARGGNVSAGNLLVTQIGTTSVTGAIGTADTALVLLGAHAVVDARGVWTNARLDPTNVAGQAYVNGGSVKFDTTGGLTLDAQSVIDVSSGGALLASGTLSGKGGSVTLIGNDQTFGVSATTQPVFLRGTIHGYGMSGGGTLTLVSPALLLSTSPLPAGLGTISLGADFFTNGFTAYDLTGTGGVTVGDGSVVQAAAPEYQIDTASGTAPTGSDPASAMQLWLPPLYTVDPLHAKLTQRPGVSLILRADSLVGTSSANGGTLSVGRDATIAVDPGKSVRLEAFDQVTVEGTISAPGGSIAVVNTRIENFANGLNPLFVPGLSVWLGDYSALDVSGVATTAIDSRGRPFGVVTAGGTITLGSLGGALGGSTDSIISTDAVIIIHAGKESSARLSANGAAALINPAAGSVGNVGSSLVGGDVAVPVTSSGGTIAMSSYSGIYIAGSLEARSGGAGSAGGTLSLTLETPLYSSLAVPGPTTDELRPRVLFVSQTPTLNVGRDSLGPGKPTATAALNQARISVQQIKQGGFDSLSLYSRDIIAFDGPVTLDLGGSIKFSEGIIGETVSNLNAHVSLSAPYVLLGGQTGNHTVDNTVTASVDEALWRQNTIATGAQLAISASLIDIANDLRFGVLGTIDSVGTISYLGFRGITLTSAGDIRFATSTFVTSGALTLTAAQVYPTTQANAEVFVGVNNNQAATTIDGSPTHANIYAPGNPLAIRWNGVEASVPYSVGGTIDLVGLTIDQGGVLRAPEGNITLGGVFNGPSFNAAPTDTSYTGLVVLRPGSVTSVSLDERSIPFGGTGDDVNWNYNGTVETSASLVGLTPSININALSFVARKGAVVDLSGGGTLTGAVFQTGKGGSTDVLLQPLLNFASGKLVTESLATNPVYAIVPGLRGGYAPTTPLDQAPSYAGWVPAIGAEIVLPTGADGLAAGTYPLLPSYYALLPGAYRVELNLATHSVLSGAQPLPDGSAVVGGYTAVANAGVKAALPVPVTVTPAGIVRTYSQYDETNYAQFQQAVAATTGAPRHAIPADAKALNIIYPGTQITTVSGQQVTNPAAGAAVSLSYAATSLFAPAAGGYGTTVTVEGPSGANSPPNFQIVGAGSKTLSGDVVISADQLDALGAARLLIGGSAQASQGGAPILLFQGQSGSVTVSAGAVLTAPELFIVAEAISTAGTTGGITLEKGATIDTVGAGAPPYDSSNGYYYNSGGYTLLAASNGRLIFTPDNTQSTTYGPITIADGATAVTAGTLLFSTTQGLSLGAQAVYGAKYLTLNVGTVNIVSDAVTKAGITIPDGLNLSQSVLTALLTGNTSLDVPGVVDLALTANRSVNLFGAVSLNTAVAGATLQQFVLNTPAIYGWSAGQGGTGDTATLSVGSGTLIWNGIAISAGAGSQTVLASQLPGGYLNTAGLASGSGTLNISGARIVLGYPAQSQAQNQVALGRIIEGFKQVNITASSSIEADNDGSLSVYATAGTQFGQAGVGGDLTLTTPVLTAGNAAILKVFAGGTLSLTGAGAGTITPAGLGGELDLSARSVALASTVALPGGRFTATAQDGVSLVAGATLALGGRTVALFDQSSATQGGSVALTATAGDVRADAKSTIDVSAGAAAAGDISVSALAGAVDLEGVLLGGAATGQPQGSIDIRAHTLTNWGPLNAALTTGGITGTRAFEIGSGDLTIADELVANHVKVVLDSGALTLTGTINASGATPGTVDLAAANGLTLAGTSVIDAHATKLRTDSYGVAIDAENTPVVTLTSTGGTLTIEGGAAIDVSAADGVARGQITLNAQRVGTTDIALNVTGPVTIKGVWTGTGAPSGSLAVYGWVSYSPTIDPMSGVVLVTQGSLDSYDADSQAFIQNAWRNADLIGRLQPLVTAAGGAFHLRPGVEIDGAGDMAVNGDLNLATYRYRDSSGNATEPGALVLRAAGNLSVNGSVTDGFAAPTDPGYTNPDDAGWVLFAGSEPTSADIVLPASLPQSNTIILGAGTTIPTANAVSLNYAVTIEGAALNTNVLIPQEVTLDAASGGTTSSYIVPSGGWVATAAIYDANGKQVYAAGALMPAGAAIQPGWTLGAGSVMPFQVNIVSGSVWNAGSTLQVFSTGTITLAADTTLKGGAYIPANTAVVLSDGAGGTLQQVNLRDPNASIGGQQGQIWAAAPMLPSGSLSWNISLVSGAMTASSDRLAVQQTASLNGSGNLILSDLHYTSQAAGVFGATPAFSVVRTGTGNLNVVSGGDVTEYSNFGLYTAGTQVKVDTSLFDLPQAGAGDGTTLGAGNVYNAFLNYHAYYPTGGGNVLISAQGGLYGEIYKSSSPALPGSDAVGNWLWRQGTGGTSGVGAQATAWWINFGNYVLPNGSGGTTSQPALEGFTGIGTLGGGNLVVNVGGNAGVTTGRDANANSQGLDLVVASTGRVSDVSTIGGTIAGGTLLQTGGGELTVTIGGALNGLQYPLTSTGVGYDGLNGTFVNLRGAMSVRASAIGSLVLQYGNNDPIDQRALSPFIAQSAEELGGLLVVPGDSQVSIMTRGDLVLGGAGDAGRVQMQNLPGFRYNGTAVASGETLWFSLWTQSTSITLQSLGGNVTPTTQFSNTTNTYSNDPATDDRYVYPPTLSVIADAGSIYYGSVNYSSTQTEQSLELAPAAKGQLQLLAQGSIFASGAAIDMSGANPNTNLNGGNDASELPNPFQPAFLTTVDGTQVSNTYSTGYVTNLPLFTFAADTPTSNVHAGDSQPARIYAVQGDIVDLRFGEVYNFQATSGVTPSTWYLAAKPAWILAGEDIVGAGQRPALAQSTVGSTLFGQFPNEGQVPNAGPFTSGNLILNNGSGDISLVSAGRDILYSYFYVAGPGLLEVDAGRNLNQQDLGILKSIGPVFDINAANRNGGAGISILAGTGSAGIDAGNFTKLYLDPASIADPTVGLTSSQNQGKVAESYFLDMLTWLNVTYGYVDTDFSTAGGSYLDNVSAKSAAYVSYVATAGSSSVTQATSGAGTATVQQQYFGSSKNISAALAYFRALPKLQQDIFIRQAFFDELVAAGREEGNPDSRRYHSYVRGTEAIYALLPGTPAPTTSDPNYGADIAAHSSVVRDDVAKPVYAGDVTMYSAATTFADATVLDAGVSTQFGGDIQAIVPGGSIDLGIAGGVQPGSNTGLITFGSGSIKAYSYGSIVLGQSRIFTTYGGNIQLWSQTGDVNAGIGSKTSVIYQPPSITYDSVADLTLAPTAPTNGAGIATLVSVPGVPAGDVDLAAPQGTIDAGEAGIRVSGNLTLAAQTVANAANLSVGGKTQGAPTIAVSNVGALNAAAATSGAAESSASGAADEQRRKRQASEASVIIVEVLGFGE